MLIYRAAFASETKVDFGDGDGATTLVDDDEAVRKAMKIARQWTEKARCDETIVVLSAVKSDSFRHRLWPTYKAGRGEKPSSYAAVRKAVEFEFEIMAEPGLEADDLLGITATADPNTVIVSGDKDMKTLPCWSLNPMHEDKPTKLSVSIADRMWMRQTMIGDAVDNYPGVPGLGDTKSLDILNNPHRLRKTVEWVGKKNPKQKIKWVKGEPCSLWQSMIDYAAKAGMTEADLILQAQLARILRREDFDPATRTVFLWTPTGRKELKL